MTDKYALTEKEAAIYIGMSRSFLRQARMNSSRENGTSGPVYTKIGRSIRYLKDDLNTWLDHRRVEEVA